MALFDGVTAKEYNTTYCDLRSMLYKRFTYLASVLDAHEIVQIAVEYYYRAKLRYPNYTPYKRRCIIDALRVVTSMRVFRYYPQFLPLYDKNTYEGTYEDSHMWEVNHDLLKIFLKTKMPASERKAVIGYLLSNYNCTATAKSVGSWSPISAQALFSNATAKMRRYWNEHEKLADHLP